MHRSAVPKVSAAPCDLLPALLRADSGSRVDHPGQWPARRAEVAAHLPVLRKLQPRLHTGLARQTASLREDIWRGVNEMLQVHDFQGCQAELLQA